jgi:hypothetical protein
MFNRSALTAANAGLAVAALLTTLAGCGGSGGDGGTTSTGTATSTGSGGAASTSTGVGGPTATGTGGGTGTGTTAGSGGAGGAPAGCKALFCDDFEKPGAIDSAKWTIDVGYNPEITMTLDSTMPAHGKNAAHAHLIDTEGGFSSLKETVTFPQLADDLWGRAYFYTAIDSGAGHTGFLSAYAGDQRVLEVGVSNGNWQLTYYDPNKEYPAGYNTPVPTKKWVCLEWHFARSGAHLIEVFIDGAPSVTYDTSGHQPPAFTAMGLGMDNHSANPPGNDVYLDDVAIDATRVGCLP